MVPIRHCCSVLDALIMTHTDLLKISLPSVSYDTAQPNLSAELTAEGNALDAAKARADAILYATLPNAGETLEDWERVYGLPCDCAVNLNLTRDQRLKTLNSKINEGGTFTKDKAIALAASVGFTITITEHRAAEYSPTSRYGTDVRYAGRDWNFVWDVNTINNTIFPRKHGANYGERYQTWGNDLLECTLKQKAQADTLVRFIYS